MSNLGGVGGGGGKNVGVPVKLLFEAEGMKITAELKNGEIYRGLLLSAEETMNISLSDVLRTQKNGQITKLPTVYLRGNSIRFIALPDLLKNAPVFQKVTTMKRKMEDSQRERQQANSKKRKRSTATTTGATTEAATSSTATVR